MSDKSKQATVPGGRSKRLVWVARLAVIPLVILAVSWFMTGMPGSSWSGPVPPLSDQELLIHDNLKRHVTELAGRVGERNVWHPEAMAAVAGYIRKTLEDAGYEVNSQSFTSRGLTVKNLEAAIPGTVYVLPMLCCEQESGKLSP